MQTRQQPRRPIDASGHCRSAHGMQWEVALFDLSEGGCRIADPHGRLRRSETVKLFIAGTGPHRAQIQWREGEEVGIQFDRPLQPNLLDQIHSGRMAAPSHHEGLLTGERTSLGPLRPV